MRPLPPPGGNKTGGGTGAVALLLAGMTMGDGRGDSGASHFASALLG